MQRLFCAKSLLAAVVAVGGLAAASVAHARSDVYFSVGVGVPYGYVQPGPIYVQPAPVYVPQPVYVQPQPIYYNGYYSNGYYDNGDHGHRSGHHHQGYRDWRWRDADRDGVPNRYDRAPNNPYRR